MMALGIWRSKHALACEQHPVPMTISSTEGSMIIDDYAKDRGPEVV